MAFKNCKLCGKLITTDSYKGLCRDCIRRLEDLYDRSRIHDYIRRHGGEKFDPDKAAHELAINPRDVRLLYDLGYLDRDIQVYSRTPSKHEQLAKEFESLTTPKPKPAPLTPEKLRPRASTMYGRSRYGRR